MAVHNDDDNNSSTPTGNGGQMASAMSRANEQARNPAGSRPQQQQQQRSLKYANLGDRLDQGPMSRNQASEHLNTFQRLVTEIIDETPGTQGYHLQVIPIEKADTTTLNISAMLLCLGDPNNPQYGITAYAFVLESTAADIATRTDTFAGNQYDIVNTTGDYIDNYLTGTCEQLLVQKYPDYPKRVIVGYEVLTRDINVADKAVVKSILRNATFACYNILLTTGDDFEDFNLANVHNDNSLATRAVFGHPAIVNAVGAPIRADIQVTLSTQSAGNGQGNNVSLNANRENELARVHGFLDLDWSPDPSNTPVFQLPGTAPVAQAVRKLYAPRFIITKIDTQRLTMSSILLALLAASQLRENNTWYQAFRASSIDGVSTNDIGAVGIEANFEGNASGIGSPIDTQSATFQSHMLGGLLNALFKQGLIISIDIDEAGPDTWILSPFADAAAGNQEARKMIIGACNILTNGKFNNHFPADAPLFIEEQNQILLGSYSDKTGVRRDIRDLGYLAVLNHPSCRQDIGLIRDWSDTFQQLSYPKEMRLSKRRQMTVGLIGGDVKITGKARRYSMSNMMLSALIAGATECGLSMRSLTQVGDMVAHERAANPYLDQTLNGANMSSMFHRGTNYNVGIGNIHGGRNLSRFSS